MVVIVKRGVEKQTLKVVLSSRFTFELRRTTKKRGFHALFHLCPVQLLDGVAGGHISYIQIRVIATWSACVHIQ